MRKEEEEERTGGEQAAGIISHLFSVSFRTRKDK